MGLGHEFNSCFNLTEKKRFLKLARVKAKKGRCDGTYLDQSLLYKQRHSHFRRVVDSGLKN